MVEGGPLITGYKLSHQFSRSPITENISDGIHAAYTKGARLLTETTGLFRRWRNIPHRWWRWSIIRTLFLGKNHHHHILSWDDHREIMFRWNVNRHWEKRKRKKLHWEKDRFLQRSIQHHIGLYVYPYDISWICSRLRLLSSPDPPCLSLLVLFSHTQLLSSIAIHWFLQQTISSRESVSLCVRVDVKRH